nr:MAG TPA: hypothetical protein [Caudoviricetes sp.]
MYWPRGARAKTQVTYDLDADILGTGGDVTETVLALVPYSDVYSIHRESGLAEPAAGGTALLHHLPVVSFFVTDHYTDPEEDIDHE